MGRGRNAWRYLAGLLASALPLGCAHRLALDQCPQALLPAAARPAAVEIRYLGTGGYLVRRGEDVVLFGPVYSNPSALEVFFDHELRTDNRLVERLLPVEADGAQAIVVGHSHYDHLMDTPFIALHRATRANVYGSRVTQFLLAKTRAEMNGRATPNDVIALDDNATARRWETLPGRRMRLLAIPSEHSDQFRLRMFGLDWAFHTWRGDVGSPRTPRSASEWAEGPTFSYLLDFLDREDGATVFRVYYQDSGTDPPIGFVPEASGHPNQPWDGRAVDVALICGGGDVKELRQHPEGIIGNTRARHVIIGHWEDFFITQRAICRDGCVRGLPLSDTRAFVKRARAAHERATHRKGRVYLPCPSASVFQIPLDPASEPTLTKGSYDCASTR